jgi:hypothetical protein
VAGSDRPAAIQLSIQLRAEQDGDADDAQAELTLSRARTVSW